MGGLRPAALRRLRPPRRLLRRQPHLRPSAHRGGARGAQGARRRHHPRIRHRDRRRRRTGGARAPAEHLRAHADLLASGERRGELRDRPPPPLPAAGPGPRSGPRCRRARLLRFLWRQRPGVPAGLRRGRLRAPAARRLSDPPRALRPPVQRLVRPRALPAHARRAPAHGEGHPRPLGTPGDGSADPALERAARRRPGAVRADAIPRRELGAGDRERRRRTGLLASRHRPGEPEPRALLRHPSRGTDRLPGLGAQRRHRPSRHRRPPGQARLRAAW